MHTSEISIVLKGPCIPNYNSTGNFKSHIVLKQKMENEPCTELAWFKKSLLCRRQLENYRLYIYIPTKRDMKSTNIQSYRCFGLRLFTTTLLSQELQQQNQELSATPLTALRD